MRYALFLFMLLVVGLFGQIDLPLEQSTYIGAKSITGSLTTTGSMTNSGMTMTAGSTLRVAAGSNTRAGNATLVAGTVTVANTTVTANTIVILSRKTIGGTVGNESYTLNAGVGFTINSSSGTDTSVMSYMLIENP